MEHDTPDVEMEDDAPDVEILDPEPVPISSTVLMARRVRVRFERTPPVTVEIEVVDWRPVIRSVTIGSDDDNLRSADLRVPLTGELLPAAVRAAVRATGASVFLGPPMSKTERRAPGSVKPGQVGVIGPPRLVARRPEELDTYDQAASAAAPRKRGRPPKVIPRAELEEIAATYSETRSYPETAARHGMSVATARRRVQKARDVGLEC